ncbi:YbhB/YbcL family Raf kinase inhibitor-like protein [Schaalia suimastitidis]|uniref:YbhB/YbcL family Raf kinase inhibitor-like protein n=1 Tax=Schaalia suimastitidis TaxID=121163 RepID=UPI00040AD092|nr:YbhB/YbcL family Raf kinase inhibitor-like protein [Schaalia suimastitidis]
MDLSSRPIAPDPYAQLPQVPSFTLSSHDLVDGTSMPQIHTADGGNISPHLAWSGAPRETESFMLTCFDPDAPTPAGWWHWCIIDLAPSLTQLEHNAGASDLNLEGAAFHLRADHSHANYFGAAPPQGDRPHRYIFAIHALNIPTLGLDDDATPTMASFVALEHTLARATLTVTYQH